MPAWRAPDQYKAPVTESPARRSSRASELMQRLETKYAVPSEGRGERGAAARRGGGAVDRLAAPRARAAHPALRAAGVAVQGRRRRPPPASEPASLRCAARLGMQIGAFEDEEIDLEAILEAHRAGDLMDLARRRGDKIGAFEAGERLSIRQGSGRWAHRCGVRFDTVYHSTMSTGGN